MQTFEELVSGTTTFGALYAKINNLAGALRSSFSGTAFPTVPSPVEGQFCYRTDTDKLYIYRNSAWEEVPLVGTLWQEIIDARGTKPSMDQRLDVSMNEDGTLKAATSLNPSQWYKPSLTFTYISSTSFKVNGDQRDIYKPTRRLKINLTGSTVYSEVVDASYAASETTITIYNAVLTNALIDVEHSLFLPTKDNGALSPEMFNEKVSAAKTSTYTTTLNDRVIPCDASGGAFTVNVLAAATAGSGRRQTFRKTDTSANAVTIACGINIVLTKYGETLEIESDGTTWQKIIDLDQYLFIPDVITDFVVSGLLGSDPGAALTMTIPGGTAYIMGKRVVKSSADADLTKLYTASKDTYVDISNAGAITYSEVANGAAAPAVAANSIRLEKVVTSGTEITGVTDLRTLKPVISASNLGILIQTAFTDYVSQATSAATIPIDDTLPQITEGYEFFTCTITPTNANNKLVIDVIVWLSAGGADTLIAALFKDAGADALVAGAQYLQTGNTLQHVNLHYEMIAGSTSAMTFRVRCGCNGGTIAINGNTSGRLLGGACRSSIKIQEIRV